MKSKALRPSQMGWMRRHELEFRNSKQVWEKPNGELFYHDPSDGQLILQLIELEESDLIND